MYKNYNKLKKNRKRNNNNKNETCTELQNPTQKQWLKTAIKNVTNGKKKRKTSLYFMVPIKLTNTTEVGENK